MPEDSPSKLISFIIGARNDSYMGDFKWRLSTTLNYLARNLLQIGRLEETEVVICDWGSDSPVSEALHLTGEACAITQFVRVPSKLAAERQRESPFPIPVVQNVAIRRASGQYIAQTDSDIMFTSSALETLFSLLDAGSCKGTSLNRALAVASRRQVPFSFSQSQPSLDEVERYLSLYGAMLPFDRLGSGFATPSALALMDRSLWEACNGYDERFIYWGWMEIDLYLRITQQYPWIDLANAGVTLYHLEHYPNGNRSLQTRKENPKLAPPKFEADQKGWGLADFSLAVETAKPKSVPSHSDSVRKTLIEDRSDAELKLEMQSEEVIQHLRKTQEKAPFLPHETAALQSLAWYSLRFRPAKYLETGIRYVYAAAIVSMACPTAEIYGTESWEPLPGHPDLSPNYASQTLYEIKHMGYVRFVAGDSDSAIHRLRNSFIGPFSVDLVMFRCGIFRQNILERALEAWSCVNAGGMLIATSESDAEFAALWREMMTLASAARGILLDTRTGILFRKGAAVHP